MALTASFSGKEKNNHTDEYILDNHNIFDYSTHRKNISDIFTTPLPARFQELVDDDSAFTKKYIQPRITADINDMDSYKIISRDDQIILVGVIRNLAYIQSLSDKQDKGTFLNLSLSPYRRNKYLFRLSTFEKIGKDKYFAVASHKYPGFGVLTMDACNIIDIGDKTIKAIPVEFSKGIYLTQVTNDPIKKKGKSIEVRCSLTDDLIRYINEFDSRHDMAESRTVYGPHYYADCEIDIESGTMKKLG